MRILSYLIIEVYIILTVGCEIEDKIPLWAVRSCYLVPCPKICSLNDAGVEEGFVSLCRSQRRVFLSIFFTINTLLRAS